MLWYMAIQFPDLQSQYFEPKDSIAMDINIAEIFFETGEIKYRYFRVLADDGTKWIRHGQFTAFHVNGQIASEGQYIRGLEQGLWRDFHENGQVAAEGMYDGGKEVGEWRFWDATGTPELDR